MLPDTDVFDLSEDLGVTAYELGSATLDKRTFLEEAQAKGRKAFEEAVAYNKIYVKCSSFVDVALTPLFVELKNFLKVK